MILHHHIGCAVVEVSAMQTGLNCVPTFHEFVIKVWLQPSGSRRGCQVIGRSMGRSLPRIVRSNSINVWLLTSPSHHIKTSGPRHLYSGLQPAQRTAERRLGIGRNPIVESASETIYNPETPGEERIADR